MLTLTMTSFPIWAVAAWLFDLTLAAAFIALIVDYGRMLSLRRKLPPGPFPWPIVGNHFQIPRKRPWIDWEKWATHYQSPLTTIWIGRQARILVQDAWAASDLMEKHSDIFSSRPELFMMGELLGMDKGNQTMLPHGSHWRAHRKLMHSVVGSQALRPYRDIQANESKLLVRDMILDPSDFVMNIERYSVSTTSIVGWGRRIDKKNDYVAQIALAVMESVDWVIPGRYLLESLPWLDYLPSWIFSFPSMVRARSKVSMKYFYMLSQEAAAAKEPNFAQRLLKYQSESGLADLEISTLTANLIGGGVDTTSSTMISCILAMCKFPEVQRKAQAEIDAVVGKDRSPDWDDVLEKLPYMAAIVKEVLRWRTVTVLAGIPHASTVDFNYEGYLIPAGTPIIGNMWAIHRNPRDFPEPDVFHPERFLDTEYKRPYPNVRGSNPFGWGRRQCSGQPFAEQGLIFSLTRLIWAFNLLPGLDDQGKEVDLDIFAYSESENTRPLPFKARFIPRTAAIEEMIMKEAEVAREALRRYDGETKLTMLDAT